MTVTRSRLLQLFDLDASTGRLYFREANSARVSVGDEAGWLADGYVSVGVDGKSYQAHRIVWFMVKGRWPKGLLDHINGDRSDNRIENLREASRMQNAQNIRCPGAANTSGYLGVSWHKAAQKWQAAIRVETKRKHLGLFSLPEEAHAAYLLAKRQYHAYCTI